ncbi:DUF5990 family protein [Sphaerisporangium siamense]
MPIRIHGKQQRGCVLAGDGASPRIRQRLHVRVQRRGRPGEVMGMVPGDAPEALWTIECRAAEARADAVDLRGLSHHQDVTATGRACSLKGSGSGVC